MDQPVNYEVTAKLLAEKVAKLELENAMYISIIDGLTKQLAQENEADGLHLMGGD